MYLFFWIFFILVSILLIFFILLQPGKGLHNITYLNSQENINLFRNISHNGLITNSISILATCFLVISLILCNMNNQRIKKDLFWKDDKKNIIIQKNISDIQKKV